MSTSNTNTDPRERLLARIEDERAQWQALVDEVGPERMNEPGPMGDWSFRDLTAHITGWRDRTIARIAAGPHGTPAQAWPSDMDDANDDDVERINDWLQEQQRKMPLEAVLRDADASFTRLADAVRQVPEDDLTTLGRFFWVSDGRSLADAELFGHIHEEHEPDIRAWLATQPRVS